MIFVNTSQRYSAASAAHRQDCKTFQQGEVPLQLRKQALAEAAVEKQDGATLSAFSTPAKTTFRFELTVKVTENI